MVLYGVNDLQERTYCIIDRIHFAGASESDDTEWRFRWKRLEHILLLLQVSFFLGCRAPLLRGYQWRSGLR